ncbi:MAG: S4 domain-containing protein YaaA [Erysipelotrichaceae bacterium]|nr:S4 domain-containing protein YaaA [Erysipelotrichaceae bacterium]
MTKITTDFITLQQLLKVEDIVGSGGAAKYFIQENDILVNGEVCKMRGKKLYPNDKIVIGRKEFTIEK